MIEGSNLIKYVSDNTTITKTKSTNDLEIMSQMAQTTRDGKDKKEPCTEILREHVICDDVRQ